jgi:hypothetical protein
MDGRTRPCLAAACFPPLSGGGLVPQNRAVCVPEIDESSVLDARLFAFEQRCQSGNTLSQEHCPKQGARALLANLKHVSARFIDCCVGDVANGLLAINGQSQRQCRRVLGQDRVTSQFVENQNGGRRQSVSIFQPSQDQG